ncbi:MAG: hypothetical protein NTW08_05310 [Gammaproteobacteria bacterium]|nr:hypothetical protein [Gammaproteobacteria bacterium]
MNNYPPEHLPSPSILYADTPWQIVSGNLSDEGQLEGGVKLYHDIVPDLSQSPYATKIELTGTFVNHSCTEGVLTIHLSNGNIITLTGHVISKGKHHLFGSEKKQVRYQGELIQHNAEKQIIQHITTKAGGYFCQPPYVQIVGGAYLKSYTYQQDEPDTLLTQREWTGMYHESAMSQGVQVTQYEAKQEKWVDIGAFDEHNCLHTPHGERLLYEADNETAPSYSEHGNYTHGVFTQGSRFKKTPDELTYYEGAFKGGNNNEVPHDINGIYLTTHPIVKALEIYIGIENCAPIKPYFFNVSLEGARIQHIALIHREKPATETYDVKLWGATFLPGQGYQVENYLCTLSSPNKSKLSLISRLMKPEVYIPQIEAFLIRFAEDVTSLQSLECKLSKALPPQQVHPSQPLAPQPSQEWMAFFAYKPTTLTLEEMRQKNIDIMYRGFLKYAQPTPR